MDFGSTGTRTLSIILFHDDVCVLQQVVLLVFRQTGTAER